MASLLERVKARMADPELNANFNREVSPKNDVSEQERKYVLVKEAFQEYKVKDPSWMQHFE
ncbi:MAG: hypothetical protein ABS939_00140 [Psychrobacillus sp.]